MRFAVRWPKAPPAAGNLGRTLSGIYSVDVLGEVLSALLMGEQRAAKLGPRHRVAWFVLFAVAAKDPITMLIGRTSVVGGSRQCILAVI